MGIKVIEHKVFKIRNKVNGKYKMSGYGWNSKGKSWSQIGHAKNAMKCHGLNNKDHEIVEFVIVERNTVGGDTI